MQLINTPIETFFGDSINTNDIYFCITHHKYITQLKPDLYENINKKFNTKYYENIRNRDKQFRKYFLNHNINTSFVQAAVIGFNEEYSLNKLFSTEQYVYYFKLSVEELNKCVFYINEDNNVSDKINDCKGINGLIKILKFYNSNKDLFKINEANSGDKPEYCGINILIPFKVKFIKYMMPYNKRLYYHASFEEKQTIDKWSLITPFKEDIIQLILPYKASDLIYCNNENSKIIGRPAKNLLFKSDSNQINDSKIYLYEITNVNSISTKTLNNIEFPSNRICTENIKVKNIEIIDSWKNYINK